MFYKSADPGQKTPMLTFTDSVTETENGSVITRVCLETSVRPLAALSFTDFSLSECIKNGVSYKSLQIDKNLHLGHDDIITSFNERLENNVESLFNSEN